MSVHSAESALSWYKSLFTKCGVRARGCGGREPDRAILANLLFPAKASAYNAGDLALIPGSGRSPGEGSGYPLQHSCLENSMDRRAWRATVHGVAKSRTRLNAQVCRVLRVRRGHLRTHPGRQRDHLRAHKPAALTPLSHQTPQDTHSRTK